MKNQKTHSKNLNSRTLTNKIETLAKKPVRDEKYGMQAPQATGKKSGLSTYGVWGKAFAQFGKQPNAPENIVKHMETEFPGRKTAWKKWVNAVRARYNAGKLPGVTRPENPIPVYKSEYLGNGVVKVESKPKPKLKIATKAKVKKESVSVPTEPKEEKSSV